MYYVLSFLGSVCFIPLSPHPPALMQGSVIVSITSTRRLGPRLRWVSATAVVAAAALALAACGNSSSSNTPTAGGSTGNTVQNASITVGLPEEIPTLDPQKREFYGISAIDDWNVFEALLKRDDSGDLQPWLASAMPNQVNSSTWQFKLRTGITFTNGEPFDADSAAFSINRIIDPKYASEMLSRLSTIKKAVAVDKTTLNVVTKSPDPILPSRIELIMMVPAKAAAEKSFGKNPVGTGPYVWKSGIGNGPIQIAANPKYWNTDVPKPSITTVNFKVIPDVSTEISALQAGEIDLLLRLGADQAKAVPQLFTAPGLDNNVVTLNSTDGITKDVRVRQALNYAIDKDALAKQLWSGYADVAKCQPVASSAFGYDDSLDAYPYDLDKAKSLLKEAGVEGDTIQLVTADGVFPQGKQMGQVIAQFWEDAGLKVDLQVPAFDPYLNALYAKGAKRPAGVYLSTTTELQDADSVIQRIFVSSADIAGYNNPTVDQLAQQESSELDPSKRASEISDLLSTTCQDAAAVYLLSPQDLYGATKRLVFTPRSDEKVMYADMSVTK
jgi:peptide/nickel transport system substrate-binding protein